MAYTHSKYEVQMMSNRTSTDVGEGTAQITVTGIAGIAQWTPGFMPHIIRAIAVSPLTTVLISGCSLLFQVTGVGSSAATIASFNFTSGDDAGSKVLFWDNLNQEVKPGEIVMASVSQLGGVVPGARVGITLYVEPRWETPANNANMRQTVT